MDLWDLRPEQEAVVKQVMGRGQMARRLMDLGLVPGTAVSCLGENPGGSLKAFCIRSAVIALRERDGRRVLLLEKGERPWD